MNISTNAASGVSQAPLAGTENPVTEAALDKKIAELKDLLEKFGRPIYLIITGIIIVLFLGFVATLTAMLAMLYEAYHWKYDSTQTLSSQLVEQNSKIDLIYQASVDKKIEVTFPQ